MNKLQQKIFAGCGIVVLALGSGVVAISQQHDSHPQIPQPAQIKSIQNDTPEATEPVSEPKAPQPVVETKSETKTRELPFETKYVDNNNTLTKGTTKVTQTGANGVETTTYTVTYTDGKETSREVTKVEVTKKPVNQIIARGTYVAPKPTTTTTNKPATTTAKPTTQDCANGTYVNSAGNTVCRPVQSSTRPAGATARCGDGSYSYSQSRRGTCSHHGGVAQWY